MAVKPWKPQGAVPVPFRPGGIMLQRNKKRQRA
jgi:hypothetical protein